jgi:hypothetical protein
LLADTRSMSHCDRYFDQSVIFRNLLSEQNRHSFLGWSLMRHYCFRRKA